MAIDQAPPQIPLGQEIPLGQARALHVRTVEIDDPGPLSELMPSGGGPSPSACGQGRASAAWIRRGDGMIGVGRALVYHPRDLGDAEAWWLAACAQFRFNGDDSGHGRGPVAFGAFTFDPRHTAERAILIVPELVIGRRDGRGWLTVVSDDPTGVPSLPAPTPEAPGPDAIAYADGGLSGLEWESAVAHAVRLIRDDRAAGLDKVVLARDLIVDGDRPISVRRLVRNLSRDYTRCWTYAIDGLVGATPEMLVRREGGLATSRVLAGTIRRSGDDEQDLALAAALSQSSKDLEEHEYAVASVAEKLAPYCSGMNVPDAPYVLELPNVLHLATDVTAVAAAGASALTLAEALHPSAAVCGTPTDRARSVIAELEQMDRERYAGPVGWVDANGDGEWAIALRCGQVDRDDPRRIRLFAGCGIVAGSDPAAELAESNAKLVPMRDALSG